MKPVKIEFNTLHAARNEQRDQGGILLMQDNKYSVCHCLAHRQPCECRTIEHINKLAPSWDETDPANCAETYQPRQNELF